MPPEDPAQQVLAAPALRKALVEAAIRAPSGDNCQPWHFRFDGNRIEIDVVPERAKSFFDFRDRGTLLSVGAVIENIRVQAACSELAVGVEYPVGERPLGARVACLSLQPAAAPADAACRERLAAVHERTVNRRPFLPMPISADMRKQWLADPVAGTLTTIIDNRRQMARWARLTYLGDRIRWTHPTIHRELFAKVLFSRAEAASKRAGLEIDRLGAGPPAAAIMRWLQPPERIVRLRRYGIVGALANQTRALSLSAGALVLLTIDSDQPEQWVRAGEQTQRLWLLAHLQGLCVQPVPVAMYLCQRYRTEGIRNFLPEHEPVLDEVSRGLDQLLGGRTGAMLFRVGHGWRMRHPAVRLPAESFYSDSGQAAISGRRTEVA